MKINDFYETFDNEMIEQANKLLLSGKVSRINEDEPQVFFAETGKAPIIFTEFEVDEYGEIIDFYCSCEDSQPCIHLVTMLMGLELMNSIQCKDIQSAVAKQLKIINVHKECELTKNIQ